MKLPRHSDLFSFAPSFGIPSTPDAAFHGDGGDNTFGGTAGDDTYYLAQGGNDTANGKGGNDTFKMGGTLATGDHLDGGSGNDIVRLDGDYSFSTIITPSVAKNIEEFLLAGGGNYNLTIYGTESSTGHVLVDATALAAGIQDFVGGSSGASFTMLGGNSKDEFFGSGKSDIIKGNGGPDILGGSSSDVVSANHDGADKLFGGDGRDVFTLGGDFTAADHIDGGDGTDIARIFVAHTGADALTFAAATLKNVEALYVGGSCTITTNDANVAADHMLNVNGSDLISSNSLIFDGSGETDGTFVLRGGAGVDTLTGGLQGDTLHGGGSFDVMTGGAGPDTYGYSQVSDSTSTAFDVIHGFDASGDFFNMPFVVNDVDDAMNSGQLRAADFDSDLTTALSGHLFADHAILFRPDSGNYPGATFLVIDANSMDGYQAGADYVIQLANLKHPVAFDALNFI